MNCNSCGRRGSIPGDAHIECRLPLSQGEKAVLVAAVLAGEEAEGLPRFHPHGIKKGWALWPVNFDPAWLLGKCPLHKSPAEVELESTHVSGGSIC